MTVATNLGVLIGLMSLGQACSSSAIKNDEGAAASRMTAVNMALPDRTPLKSVVPDIEAKMNAYQLQISPKAACPGFVGINQIGDYAGSTSINASLLQGCDYDVLVAVGQKSAVAGDLNLAAIYYKNNGASSIMRSEIAGKADFPMTVTLGLQEAGRLLGLGKTQVVPPIGGSTVPVVNNNQPTQPTPVNLGQGDLQINNGMNTMTLSSVFKGQQMLLDFSASWCGYCVQAADEINQSPELQAMLNGTKCSYAVIVAREDLGLWKNKVGANSFVAQHSYAGTGGSLVAQASKLGIQANAIPAMGLIDTNGRLSTSGAEIPVAQMQQVCK